MSRGATPYATRGTTLALPKGTLENPALRLGGERLGLYRVAPARLGLGVNRFRAVEVAEQGTIVRSNAPGAGNVAPLAFARANPTTDDGQETALDSFEGTQLRGRLALYRQETGKYGWRLYGSTGGALTTDLTLTGDGDLTTRRDLHAVRDVRADRDLVVAGAGSVTGQLTLNQAVNQTALSIPNGNAVLGGTLRVTGMLSANGGITLPAGGLSIPAGGLNGNVIQARTLVGTQLVVGTLGSNEIAVGGVHGNRLQGNTVTTNEIQDGTILGSDINAGTSISVAGLTVGGLGATLGGVVRLTGAGYALQIDNSMNVGSQVLANSLSALSATLTSSGASALDVTGGGSFGGSLRTNGNRFYQQVSASAVSQIISGVVPGERQEIQLWGYNAGVQAVIGLGAGAGQYMGGYGDLSIYTATAGALHFGVASSRRMSITASGDVNIDARLFTTAYISFTIPGSQSMVFDIWGNTCLSASGGAIVTYMQIRVGGSFYKLGLHAV